MTANISKVRAPLARYFEAATTGDSKVGGQQAQELVERAKKLNAEDNKLRSPTPNDRGTKNLVRLYDQNKDAFDKDGAKVVENWINRNLLSPVLVWQRACHQHKLSKNS